MVQVYSDTVLEKGGPFPDWNATSLTNTQSLTVTNNSQYPFTLQISNATSFLCQAGFVTTIPIDPLTTYRLFGASGAATPGILQYVQLDENTFYAGYSSVPFSPQGVNILNSPSVTITGTVTATITGPVTVSGTVNVGNTPAVTISGTPTVNIGNSPTVSVSGTVNVSITAGTVGITGPVSIQNVAAGTIVAAGSLRFLQTIGPVASGAGSGAQTQTLQTYERALIIQMPALAAPTATDMFDVSVVGHVANTTVVLRKTYAPGQTAIAYVNPALDTTWDVTITNYSTVSASFQVFADVELPLIESLYTSLRQRIATNLVGNGSAASGANSGNISSYTGRTIGGAVQPSVGRVQYSFALVGTSLTPAIVFAELYITDGSGHFWRLADVIVQEGVPHIGDVSHAESRQGIVLTAGGTWSVVFTNTVVLGTGTLYGSFNIELLYGV